MIDGCASLERERQVHQPCLRAESAASPAFPASSGCIDVPQPWPASTTGRLLRLRMMSRGCSGTSLAAPAARGDDDDAVADLCSPVGRGGDARDRSRRRGCRAPATRFFSGSAIADTASNSLFSSTGVTLKAAAAPFPASTTSCDRVAGIAQAEVVVHRRQVVGRLSVNRHQDVADLQAGGLRGAAGPDVGDDDAVVSAPGRAPRPSPA